jgi:hypothetical protein
MRKTLLIWAAITIAAGFVFSGPAASRNGAGSALSSENIPNGTHFLIQLDNELRTGRDKVNKKFDAKTLDPLEASSGYVLPAGARVRGHISRIEPGGLTGHARLWLTFDDIDTHHGRLPIVAEVSSVPLADLWPPPVSVRNLICRKAPSSIWFWTVRYI